jgi:hypothetical protein
VYPHLVLESDSSHSSPTLTLSSWIRSPALASHTNTTGARKDQRQELLVQCGGGDGEVGSVEERAIELETTAEEMATLARIPPDHHHTEQLELVLGSVSPSCG